MSEAKTRVPIEAGFFTVPEDREEPPRLLATRCNACSEVFFPRRLVCAKCLSQDVSETEVGPRGTLYTWTFVHFPMFGSSNPNMTRYGVGQVDLPEGPRVQGVLSGKRDEFRIGMEMELELETLRENQAGDEIVIFRFRPTEARAS